MTTEEEAIVKQIDHEVTREFGDLTLREQRIKLCVMAHMLVEMDHLRTELINDADR